MTQFDRRRFVGGAVAVGGSARCVHTAFAQGTPTTAGTPADGTVFGPNEVVPDEYFNQPQVEFPLSPEKITLQVMVSSIPAVGSFSDNEMTKWYEELTNVHVEWTELPPGDSLTALNVRLASGDYTEVLLGLNPAPAVMQTYGDQGTFLPLNDLIDQHGVLTSYIFDKYPITRSNVTASDGQIYSLPYANECYHCTYSRKLWIYQPWLDKLGLEMPQTTEAYRDVLRAFKNDDPTGTGQGGIIPLTGSPGGWNSNLDYFFMNSFVFTPPSRLYADNGEVKASYVQDGWREGIKYLASLFAEGLISPESFTQDADALTKLATAEPPVVGSFPMGWLGNIASDWDRGSQFKTVPPLEGPDGTRWSSYDPVGNASYGTFIITDKCKDPELAFKWADAMYGMMASGRTNNGVYGTDWRFAYADEVGIDGNPAQWTKLQWQQEAQTRHWSGTGIFNEPSTWRLGMTAEADVPRDRSVETILYDETKKNYEPYMPPSEWILPILYFNKDQAQTIAELATAIDPFVMETFSQAIIGAQDIDATWNDYLATLDAMGFQEYMATQQDAYDAKMKAS